MNIFEFIAYKIRFSYHGLKCGWHSGFRLCDILWFCFFWAPFGLMGEDNPYRIWMSKRERHKAQYVECPLCLIIQPKIIKFKKCKCFK